MLQRDPMEMTTRERESAPIEAAFMDLYQMAMNYQAYSHERYAVIGRMVCLKREDPRHPALRDLNRTLEEMKEPLEQSKAALDAARSAYDLAVITHYLGKPPQDETDGKTEDADGPDDLDFLSPETGADRESGSNPP